MPVLAVFFVVGAVVWVRLLAKRGDAPSAGAGILAALAAAIVTCAVFGNLVLRIPEFSSALYIIVNAATMAVVVSVPLYFTALLVLKLTRAGGRMRLLAPAASGVAGAFIALSFYLYLQSPSVLLKKTFDGSIAGYRSHVSRADSRLVRAVSDTWRYAVRLDMDPGYVPEFSRMLALERAGDREAWDRALLPAAWRADVRPEYYYHSRIRPCSAYITPQGRVYLLLVQ